MYVPCPSVLSFRRLCASTVLFSILSSILSFVPSSFQLCVFFRPSLPPFIHSSVRSFLLPSVLHFFVYHHSFLPPASPSVRPFLYLHLCSSLYSSLPFVRLSSHPSLRLHAYLFIHPSIHPPFPESRRRRPRRYPEIMFAGRVNLCKPCYRVLRRGLPAAGDRLDT